MTKRWEDVPKMDKDLVETILRTQRRAALGVAVEMITELMKDAPRERVDAVALSYAKAAEDTIDAALERLGFRA